MQQLRLRSVTTLLPKTDNRPVGDRKRRSGYQAWPQSFPVDAIMGMAAPFDQMAEIFPATPAVSVQWIGPTERSFLVQRKAANASGQLGP